MTYYAKLIDNHAQLIEHYAKLIDNHAQLIKHHAKLIDYYAHLMEYYAHLVNMYALNTIFCVFMLFLLIKYANKPLNSMFASLL